MSLLMLGDSTSAQVLWHACEAFNVKPRSFVPVDAKALNISLKRYSHRLRSLDNHACRLPANFTLGSFSHYGATGPPYWVFAYPLAPWLAPDSLGMVQRDVPRFRALTHPRGADPTVIVASSLFWDVASWWAHEANFSKSWHGGASAAHVAAYVTGVRRLVREVRRQFPRSLVVWRLMHPGQKHSITPKIVKELNGAVRALAPSWRLPLLDTEAMVESLSKSAQPLFGARGPPYGTSDGRHLHPFVNLAILNVLFNMVLRVSEGAVPYAGWLSRRTNRTAGGTDAANRTGGSGSGVGGMGVLARRQDER